jgi:hypothetical protein
LGLGDGICHVLAHASEEATNGLFPVTWRAACSGVAQSQSQPNMEKTMLTTHVYEQPTPRDDYEHAPFANARVYELTIEEMEAMIALGDVSKSE